MSDQHNGSSRDLDEIPVIAAEKHELDSRRRTLAAPRQSNFRGLLVFSLVLMGVMLGIGGYTLYEVQQRLDQSNELLDLANKGVRDLEARLAATGTDVSKELQTLKEQQTTNFSEIDKLWRIPYRENRPAISKIEQSVKDMAGASGRLDLELAGLKTKLSSTADTIAVLTRSVTTDSDELKTTVSLVRGQVQDQADQSEAQKRSITTINRQLKDVEEAIDAIDRYRQQVNQQLIELQNAQSFSVPAG
ncbi:MAG: chromosome segregation ATPase [Litorivivens sp.]|jgi:chromosome segregation ATPase